ncbi:MAG: hypothetical protein ABI415_06775 [Flavitalea sp.]
MRTTSLGMCQYYWGEKKLTAKEIDPVAKRYLQGEASEQSSTWNIK